MAELPEAGAFRTDGRSARAERTRDAVVDAMLALIEAGDLRPTAPRVAERAGVSLRSVYQHCTDLEDLFARAADRQIERLQQIAQPLAYTGPLSERIRAYVCERTRLLEAAAAVRRAAALAEPFSKAIASRLAERRALNREQLQRIFASELATATPDDRQELLEALVAMSDWYTWESLRKHQHLSPDQSRAVMQRLLTALLGDER